MDTQTKPSDETGAANEEKVSNAPWLIMLYLAGDNNLTEEMVLALQALAAEGPPHEGTKIVAQFDPSGVGLESQRYRFIGTNGADGVLTLPRRSGRALSRGGVGLMDLPDIKALEEHRVKDFVGSEFNTGSPEALIDFTKWGRSHDTTGKLSSMLVLSGHGGGTSADYLLKDGNAQDALSMEELRDALDVATLDVATKKRRAIDLLGLDACFMSMGEVAYEIAPFARILVAAEGMEPAFGWPYSRLLSEAKARAPFLDPEALASLIVEEYVKHYNDFDRTAGRSADLSAIRLKAMQPVVDAFGALVRALTKLVEADDSPGKKLVHNKLVLAHWYAQTYKFDQYVDLKDLCLQIQEHVGLKTECKKVLTALKSCIIKSGCSGFAYQHSHGLSIYFPWAFVSPDYANLKFAKATGWYEFLEVHVKKTQRKAREGFIVADGGDVPGTVEDLKRSKKARKDNLLKLKHACQNPDTYERASKASNGHGDIDRAIANQFRKFLRRRQGNPSGAIDPGLDAKLNGVIDAVAAADLPDADIPQELARRFLRGGSFGERKSRFEVTSKFETPTKFGEVTRSPADRERVTKNLPPVIGMILEP